MVWWMVVDGLRTAVQIMSSSGSRSATESRPLINVGHCKTELVGHKSIVALLRMRDQAKILAAQMRNDQLMSGLNPAIIYAVARLESEFCDHIGNFKCISGTGFWLGKATSSSRYFVTNRHNVDPTVNFGNNPNLKLHSLRIEHRLYDGPMRRPLSDTRFFECDLQASKLRWSKECDVAILFNPVFEIDQGEFKYQKLIPISEVADTDFLSIKLTIMDSVSFLGYPGSGNNKWWDTACNLAIARTASIASIPNRTFVNPSVIWKNIVLVSGLSFSGSSGSPVLSFQKGVPTGRGLSNPSYVAPKLIGIMSGHWWDDSSTPEMYKHTGLSYFTRSTSILDLINTYELEPGDH